MYKLRYIRENPERRYISKKLKNVAQREKEVGRRLKDTMS